MDNRVGLGGDQLRSLLLCGICEDVLHHGDSHREGIHDSVRGFNLQKKVKKKEDLGVDKIMIEVRRTYPTT